MEQQPSAVDLLESLTETQRQAVQHVDGPLIVLAGPGSGKNSRCHTSDCLSVTAGNRGPTDLGTDVHQQSGRGNARPDPKARARRICLDVHLPSVLCAHATRACPICWPGRKLLDL